MKALIIVGTGSFAELMLFYLKNYGSQRIAAFSVEQEYICEQSFQGLPVCPLEELTNRYPPDGHDVLLAVGAKDMNRLRERLFRFCKAKGYAIASFVHPTCVISPDAQIGEGNIFLENVLVQPFVKIGDGNLVWYQISIAHNNVIGDFNTITGGARLAGFVTVGNNCYFGNSSMVFDHVVIANHTLVGACAYVKKDTEEYDVIVPARSATLKGKRSTDFQV